MSLDRAISETEYILDCLRAYREIATSGCCNDCRNGGCEWKPRLGQLVRYNCPHYKRFDAALKTE